jgi:hypothetical protein
MKHAFRLAALLFAFSFLMVAGVTLPTLGMPSPSQNTRGTTPPATTPAATTPRNAPAAGSSTQPADVAAALKAARGIALIEVTSIKEQDNRPADGPLVDIVSFVALKSTGVIPASIVIIKEYGGLPAPSNADPVVSIPRPGGPLYPNPLEAGQRYWIIFNETDYQKYPQAVVAWWPEKNVPAAVEAACSRASANP